MRNRTFGALAIACLWTATTGLSGDAPAQAVDGKAAFEELKKLDGDWEGHVMTSDGPEMAVSYRVTAAGSVVMERLFPGTPHEMVTMYHVDGKDLVLTHYCAAGNQPRLRLNPATSKPRELSFDFVGGSNLDPAVDSHMHSGRVLLKDDAHIESVWIGYDHGKPSGTKRFILTRKQP